MTVSDGFGLFETFGAFDAGHAVPVLLVSAAAAEIAEAVYDDIPGVQAEIMPGRTDDERLAAYASYASTIDAAAEALTASGQDPEQLKADAHEALLSGECRVLRIAQSAGALSGSSLRPFADGV